MGTALAAADHLVRWPVVALCALTTVLLQILSNLANDYGDTQNGADSALRQGPARAVQSGAITLAAMRRGIGLCAALALISGLALLWAAFGRTQVPTALTFLALGLVCIWAAYRYTAGTNPYGYAGWGDAAVFVFFGLAGVLGTYFLQAHAARPALVLPAAALGLLSAGVLNVNNIRDLSSDAATGKRTIPVRLGPTRARVYHALLLGGALTALIVFAALERPGTFRSWLFVLAAPLLARNAVGVWRARTAAETDPFLKRLALTTVAVVALWWAGV
ncbi:MAG: 1,4-dihydroxy-2-naphthoate octaprenyltransferase [Hymenobacteraceae bacterium]|nr:1,4-dihydroxy-2-naphthoate octaprenyltransferase [Hymenobacteraceae bacterium]